jgi:hypothetical protein
MNSHFLRAGALLAINVLFLVVWGFAGIGKLIDGVPPWFGDKFGPTFLAKFPGLTATFWMLAISEVLAFALAAITLLSGEFLRRKPPVLLQATLVWSLFVFIQLGFGQWLTLEYNGAFQQFMYFSGTMVSLAFASLPALAGGAASSQPAGSP